MVRTVNRVEDDETYDSSSPIESKRVGRKGNAARSKHSETEQRRRSKINERFQILMDLIPENDQKRDKASFLLEVIEYVKFLQERVQFYEGSCQVWRTDEPSKLTPRRVNSGPVEGFIDQSQIESHLSGQEDDILFNPIMLSDLQNSVMSDMPGPALCKTAVNPAMTMNEGLLLGMEVQPPDFEGSFPDVELSQQLGTQFWRGEPCMDDCSVPIYSINDDELKNVAGEPSVSAAYSQKLFNSLTDALQSSGVDTSQAKISVQLDVGKRTNVGRSEEQRFNMKDHENMCVVNTKDAGSIRESDEHPHKRFRAT